MATLCRTFTVCVLFTALFAWSKVTALSEASIIIIIPSNGASISSSMLSTHLSMTATARPNSTITPSPNMTTVPSPNKTVTPSPNMTTVPSPNKTVTPSPNMTTVPSPNRTVTPSPNMTTVPSPNRTVTPSPNMTTVPSPNKTVTPSPNMTTTYSHNMTIMPHNATVMPSMPSHSMTIVPSSAHSVMPTSSAHPTPPSPTWGNFSVKNKNNTACLIANMGATFNVRIRSKESTIELPVNASPSGACAGPSSKQPYITLQWHTPEGSYNFTMHFVTYAKKKEDFNAASSQRWAAANLTFSLETQDGGTKTFHSAPEILTELSADLGSSYQCLTSATDFKLMAVNSSVNVSLIHIEFQPFEVQGGHLGKAEVCATPVSTTHSPSGKTTAKPPKKSGSHVVAIAVGCSLAGLVVIVIVGYVIGRRRSRNASAGYRQL